MKYLKVFLALFMMILLTVPSLAKEIEFKKILGLWEFSAPNAPQPYNQGTLTLKDVEQKLVGFFKVEGQELSIAKVEFANDILHLEFEVENTPISLKLVLKDGIFQGTTDTPNGQVTVTAKPLTPATK